MKKLLYILCLSLGVSGYSQEILTKEQALQTLLENNYAVKLSKNTLKTAQNNASIYNSHYLPVFKLGAGANYSLQNQEIGLQNGTTSSSEGNETTIYSASFGTQYPVFTGFSRKYAYKQLQEQLAISELEAKATLEAAMLKTYSLYYQTAQHTENVAVLRRALDISRQRLQRSIYQYNYGQATKLAVLHARVDRNNDSINYINARQALDISKKNLLLSIGDTTTRNFKVETGVSLPEFPDLQSLLADLPQNTQMQMMEKTLKLHDYNIRMSQSGYLPSVGVSASYGWNYSDNPVTSQTASLSRYGFTGGVNLSWNIFDGGSTKVRLQNAKINRENQLIRQEELRHQLQNSVSTTYYSYQNKLFVWQSQKQNLETAEMNFKRTAELFKTGRVSSVEYRQAQLNLLHAQTAILNAKYEAKIVALQLMQLTGKLLEE